ncbi:MAG TPA: FHA domain-containing protein [bacterium]
MKDNSITKRFQRILGVLRSSDGDGLIKISIALDKGDKDFKYPLKDLVVSIGRGRENDIMIDDKSVSRTHARIRENNGKIFIIDENSTNGIIVDGKRIDGNYETDLPVVFKIGNVSGSIIPVAGENFLEDNTKNKLNAKYALIAVITGILAITAGIVLVIMVL